MTAEEYIQRYVASKQLRLDANGNPTGVLVPMISVPIKQAQPTKGRGMFPDIPAKLDADGDPQVRLFPKTQIKQYEMIGWSVYKTAKVPKGVAKSAEAPPVKKGPFGRPIKEVTTEILSDEVDSEE